MKTLVVSFAVSLLNTQSRRGEMNEGGGYNA
jgi:hypothetical protein